MTLTKLFVLMKNATRHECNDETKKSSCDLKKQIKIERNSEKIEKNSRKDDQQD